MADTLEGFWSLVQAIPICLMTTRDANALRSRPMMVAIDRGTHEFRFLTRLSSHKTDELAANPEVNLAFADPQGGHFVSISGQAYLTQDRQLIDQLWNCGAEAFLGCGRDDPDVAVIRVVPSQAECWDSRSTLQTSWNVFKPRQADVHAEPVRAAG